MSAHHQRGAILLVGLLFLLIMSIVGVQLSKRSILDQHMATNQAVRTIAFENAESALAQAESLIPALAATQDAQGGTYDCFALGIGYYAASGIGTGCSSSALSLTSMSWDDTDSVTHTTMSDRRYVIEYLGIDEIKSIGDDVEIGGGVRNTTTVHVYRAVGRGVQAAGAEIVLQSLIMVIKS